MQDQAKTILFGFILFSLFAFLIVTVVNEQGALYGKTPAEITEVTGSINYTGLNNSLTSSAVDSNSLRDSFQKQNIFVTLGSLVISGAFGIFTQMINMILTPFVILQNAMTNILGVPPVVQTTLTILIGFTIIFGLWRLIKFGD